MKHGFDHVRNVLLNRPGQTIEADVYAAVDADPTPHHHWGERPLPSQETARPKDSDMPKDRKLQEPWANDPRNVPPAERRLQGRATSRTSRCECDLRHRQWNPHTGRCETCRCTYVDPDPHGIPPNSSIDAMEES